MSFSVGDFAEQILSQDRQKAAPPLAPPSLRADPSVYSPEIGNQVDISEVQVPSDFVNSIVEGKAPVVPLIEKAPVVSLNESITPQTEAVSEPDSSNQNQDLWDIMEDVKQLLIQVKETLTEMTTVGALGVNLANNTKTPKKPKNKEEDAMTALLKRIKNKRKVANK
jgi:hypothetical protein